MVSPSRMLKVTLASVVVLALVGSALADMYLHHPPGSNDRNRERNENRDNGNRLFDSQNNGKGGYPWRGSPTAQAAPDPLTYYTGSRLRIEWTNQHACGVNPNVHCEILLQYACNDDLPGLRDGYPESENLDTTTNPGFPTRQFSGQGGQNQQGTNTIDDNKFNDDPVKRAQFFTEGKFGGIEFGLHEGIDWYNNCKTRQRNKGLYTSDQKLNGNTARFTRQNPNGNRRGLECPEERDYYPYWHPTPWRDVAVLVSNIDFCPYYQQNSQNVKEVGYCANCGNTCRQQTADNTIPIEEAQCKAAGGTWTLVAAKGGGAPVCQLAPLSRDNHLGNAVAVAADGTLLADTIQPEAAHYDWEIPAEMSGKTCIVRVRYNMSTEDYPSHAFAQPGTLTVGFNAANNCPRVSVNNADENQQSTTDVSNPSCVNQLTVNSRPLYNRPYVDLFGIGTEKRLALAINTHQTGRTFQDRSYVFKVADPPATVAGRRIFNLNTRGRRGNIVQCYPAVEYDFVPARLDLTQGDVLHIQFHGSDFNAARNANDGEGNQYTDRFNLVQTPLGAINYPLTVEEMTLFGDNREAYLRWALLGQENCVASSDGANNEQNIVSNCGKLNRAPNRFPASPELGLVGVSAAAGEYSYMSTRNNNFSNRSMKGSIIIRSNGLSAGAIVAIAFSSIAVCLFGVGGTMFYGKRHPQSRAGAFYSKTAACFSRPSAAGGSTSRPTADLEYARSTNTTAM